MVFLVSLCGHPFCCSEPVTLLLESLNCNNSHNSDNNILHISSYCNSTQNSLSEPARNTLMCLSSGKERQCLPGASPGGTADLTDSVMCPLSHRREGGRDAVHQRQSTSVCCSSMQSSPVLSTVPQASMLPARITTSPPRGSVL